jgi:hypothetical protein
MIKATLDSEWMKKNAVKRTFTDLGFNRGRLPHDLWGSISAYHYNNRNSKSLEEWYAKGVFVNWYDAPVYFIPMPWKLKVLIFLLFYSNCQIKIFLIICKYHLINLLLFSDILANTLERTCRSLDRS